MKDYNWLIKFMLEDYKPSKERLEELARREKVKQEMTVEERIQENRFDRWLDEMCKKYFCGKE